MLKTLLKIISLSIIVAGIAIVFIPKRSFEIKHEPIYERLRGVITAYSSRVQETDSSPFFTASNQRVRWGVVANNCLPFGTKVAIAGEVFEVQDRMNRRFGCEYFDIWFDSTTSAKDWGMYEDEVIIIKEE